MAYTAGSFSANEQPTTSKWNQLWNNDASFNDGTGIGNNAIKANHIGTDATYAWTSWTPSWINYTIGNAVVTARYNQTGKTVNYVVGVVTGTTTAWTSGGISMSLPVTQQGAWNAFSGNGLLYLYDGTNTRLGFVQYTSTTQVALICDAVVGGFIGTNAVTGTAPITITGAGKTIYIVGSYEAA